MAGSRDKDDKALGQLFSVLDKLPFVSGLKRDVNSLRQVIYQRRAPRVAAVGGDGVGRTRLGNALLGKDALPSGGRPADGQWIRVDAEGAVIDWLELTLPIEDDQALDRALGEGQPDVVLFIAGPSEVGSFEEPVERVRELVERMGSAGDRTPVVIPLLSQCDRIATPERSGWDEDALASIDLGRQRLEKAVEAGGLTATAPISVAVPEADLPGLGLMALTEALYEALPDPARLEGARALTRADKARREVANRVVHSTSTLALTIGLAPIPLSDVFIIAPLQVMMVSAVAHLGGRPWDKKAVLEWIASMGVVGGAGLGLRWTAQQLVKLVPGAGSLVSAGVAGAGTVTLGQSAIAYFLRDGGARQIPENVAA